eukprot:TRINITY_DN8043_c0_g1_i1.p1 TRINITY_DN8043_c0_g1~~TRINITY_DN8043_c0_g1_i1.p1  ORF type:complete len:336 (-),score=49.74 TRINITY_DN8043_c0_g1_i1:30-1037(-)
MSLSRAVNKYILWKPVSALCRTPSLTSAPQQSKTKRFRHYSTQSRSKFSGSPALITVAITGDVATQERVSVPITPSDQVDAICKCFEAGARMVHVHVRDQDGKPSWEYEQYQKVLQGSRSRCPDMILQFTTGNYAPNISERAKFLDLRPEMASLTPGSVNFRASRPGKDTAKKYYNTHEEIDFLAQKMLHLDIRPDIAIFDLSMIYATADLLRRGLLKKPMRLMFVLGGHMALEARREVLEFLVKEAENQFGPPGGDSWTWCGVGVGWNHESIQRWTLELGGHPRTGFEDSLMIKRGKFAKSNDELVKYIANLCQEFERPVATPQQARSILGLSK